MLKERDAGYHTYITYIHVGGGGEGDNKKMTTESILERETGG